MTEMVTGLDLVEWQLRVAAGEPLPLQQAQLTMAGHSFEARIYAEDPEAGFLPGSGTLRHLRTPAEEGDTYAAPELRGSADGHAVRLDSGVEQGDVVSVFYDPMLAKLIVRGADRPLALRAMQRALAGWESSGLPTNVLFLRRVCGSEAFSAGHVHTAFIDDHKAELLPASPPAPHSSLLFLSALHWLGARSLALATALPPGSPVASSAFTSLGGSEAKPKKDAAPKNLCSTYVVCWKTSTKATKDSCENIVPSFGILTQIGQWVDPCVHQWYVNGTLMVC